MLIYCFKVGFYWRGIKHDISKFSFTEFWYSVENYDITENPFDYTVKTKNGVNEAWVHFINYNDYRIEHWTYGPNAYKMPFASASECAINFIASEKAMSKLSFSYINVFKRYCNLIDSDIVIHPQTKKFIYYILADLANDERYEWSVKNILTKKYFKKIYLKAEYTNEKTFVRDRLKIEKCLFRTEY